MNRRSSPTWPPPSPALKAQPGGTIGIQGSPTLVRYLLSADLIDRLTRARSTRSFAGRGNVSSRRQQAEAAGA